MINHVKTKPTQLLILSVANFLLTLAGDCCFLFGLLGILIRIKISCDVLVLNIFKVNFNFETICNCQCEISNNIFISDLEEKCIHVAPAKRIIEGFQMEISPEAAYVKG